MISFDHVFDKTKDLATEIILERLKTSIWVDDYSTVRRSWQERLFTFPWTPLEKTKRMYNPRIVGIRGGEFFCSPETYSKIEKGEMKMKDICKIHEYLLKTPSP